MIQPAPSSSSFPAAVSQSDLKRTHSDDRAEQRPGDTYINRIFDQKKLEEVCFIIFYNHNSLRSGRRG